MLSTLSSIWRVSLFQHCDDLCSKQIKENRQKLEAILKVVIFCGHQNIPLRGHRDDSKSTSVNKGNFLALVDFRCEAGDEILTKHLKYHLLKLHIYRKLFKMILSGLVESTSEIRYWKK